MWGMENSSISCISNTTRCASLRQESAVGKVPTQLAVPTVTSRRKGCLGSIVVSTTTGTKIFLTGCGGVSGSLSASIDNTSDAASESSSEAQAVGATVKDLTASAWSEARRTDSSPRIRLETTPIETPSWPSAGATSGFRPSRDETSDSRVSNRRYDSGATNTSLSHCTGSGLQHDVNTKTRLRIGAPAVPAKSAVRCSSVCGRSYQWWEGSLCHNQYRC
jgi:hypothetical protein